MGRKRDRDETSRARDPDRVESRILMCVLCVVSARVRRGSPRSAQSILSRESPSFRSAVSQVTAVVRVAAAPGQSLGNVFEVLDL